MFIGEKCLFYYKDSNGKDHFFIQKNDGFETLIHKKYYKETSGGYEIFENKTYVGQLKIYFQEYPENFNLIERTNFSVHSLYDLFSKYYKLANLKPQYSKNLERLYVEFGLIAGISTTQLIVKSNSGFASIANKEYSKSFDFTGGLAFDLILPRNKKKMSINSELIYVSYLATNHSEYFYSEDHYVIRDTQFGFGYLKLNNMFRYKLLNKNTRIYLNAGISNGISVTERNHQKVYIYDYGREQINEGAALDDTRKYEQGFLFGIGGGYGKFSIESRYEHGNGFSWFNDLVTSTNRFYILFNYSF